MYAYRRMTPQQRKAVVAERISHGRPWHKPPHLKAPEGWYFISAACYEHRLQFTDPAELTALQRRLFKAFAEAGCSCASWVVMPNHYHALLKIDSFKNFGKAIGLAHGRSSFYANQRDGTAGRQVWYKYVDRAIRSERHFWACLHYIIANPVKHGFAERIDEWPWSSYHELLADHGPDWIDDLCREFPLHGFGKGWDDWCVGDPRNAMPSRLKAVTTSARRS
jgi:putative transposase